MVAQNIVVIDQIGMEDGFQITPSYLSSTTKLFYFSPPIPWSGVTQAVNFILITGGPSTRREEIIYVNKTYANVTLAFVRCCVKKDAIYNGLYGNFTGLL